MSCVGHADDPGSQERRGLAEHLAAEAEALGIPWEKILAEEILTEGTLRRYLPESDDLPLWRAISILPNSLLRSWRVRAGIERLSWQASLSDSREAARDLANLHEHLRGGRTRREEGDGIMAKHFWFAYQRVLELREVLRAAARSRGPEPERIEALCVATGCSKRDAEWAVRRADSGETGRSLEDSVERAREEGFDIPRAATEIEAMLLLRKFIGRHPLFRPPKRRPSRAAHRRSATLRLAPIGRADAPASAEGNASRR